jgi:hypothetical protein
MSRAGPLGKKTTLLIGIHQSFLHLHIFGGIDKIKEREKTPESIPETGIGEHIARKHFPVVRTVMVYIAIGVDLGEISREEQCAIEVRVECSQVIDIVILYPDPSQHFIPTGFSLFPDGFERVVSLFPQVE